MSVVIPSETMETKKMGKKGQERERSSSLFRSQGSPNQTANGTAERAVRERIRTPKKGGKFHMHACPVSTYISITPIVCAVV